MPKCKLCNEEKPLIKKSHIIPNFMYKDLYDENHRIRKFDAIEKSKGIDKVSKPPTGEYEGGILCKECDNEKIGQFESYLSKILTNPNIPEDQKPKCEKITNDTGVEFTRVTNIDYKSVKLALLSILWRASISNRPMFNEVDLGPLGEKIRKMIDSETPSNDKDISIVVMSWHNDDKTAKDIIAQPRRHKKDGKTHYSFIIGGYIVIFYISDNSIRKEVEPFRLQSDDSLSIIHLPKGKGMEFLVDYSGAGKK
ncbi:hypothetical protein ACT3CD_11590 [Geofilum sp. OHC36d9]|uniref:hypothetical protein n=1 Tax=Geofilum sp. OHC36d9 TaxID=3458413 RepID=UPI004033F624